MIFFFPFEITMLFPSLDGTQLTSWKHQPVVIKRQYNTVEFYQHFCQGALLGYEMNFDGNINVKT